MDWYDRADLYDRLFAGDVSAERDFVLGASERWGLPAPRRILEPFCGSGRLLRAMPGSAIGFDANPHMVRFAAARAPVFRADAGRFALRENSFDLAYALVDSFRYLRSGEEAARHLAAMGRALRPGAVYVLGFELEGDVSKDAWERDGVRVEVGMLGDADPATRIESMRARLWADGRMIETIAPMRTYSARQVEDLVDREGSFEIAAAFDYRADLARPVELEEVEGSLLLVLQSAAGGSSTSLL